MKKQEITKPYRVTLEVDNRPLPYKSITTSALVHRSDIPLYNGEIRYQRNPFWITCCGSSEFGVMKLARSEWPGSKVVEIREHQNTK